MDLKILATLTFLHITGVLVKSDLHLDAETNRITKLNDYAVKILKERGYDPFRSEGNKHGIRYNYVFPGGLNLHGYYENFVLKGISEFLIKNISSFEDLFILDMTFPRLGASVDNIYVEVALGNFYRKLEVQGRLVGTNVSLISKVPKQYDELSNNGASVDIRVENIKSHLAVKIGEVDYSDSVNEFIEQNLPSILSYPFQIIYEEDFDFIVMQVIYALINAFFDNSSI